jgi:hypothetical protein
MFGSFMLLTFCLYLTKTVPAACSIGPEPFPAAADTISNTGQQQQQQQWPLAWRFFCRSPLSPVPWPLATRAQHPPTGVDTTVGSCANPAAPQLVPQGSLDASQAADPHSLPTAASVCQPEPAEVTQRGTTTRGSWRQQAASSARGRLKSLAARLLSKAAVLLLAAVQVSKQSQLLS